MLSLAQRRLRRTWIPKRGAVRQPARVDRVWLRVQRRRRHHGLDARRDQPRLGDGEAGEIRRLQQRLRPVQPPHGGHRQLVLDCSDHLEGSEAECADWIEDCTPRVLSAAELAEYAATDIPPSVRGETAMERELIQAAWALLQDNLDLVRWAICMRYGADKAERVMDRLTDHVDGTLWTGVYVADVSFGGPFFVPPFIPTPFNPTHITRNSNALFIVRGSGLWQGYLEKWSSGDLSSQSCVALDFAAGIAHELCHVARYNAVDLEFDDVPLLGPKYGDGVDSRCFDSYIIGNSIRWALFQRYPPASMVDQDCCEDKAKDSMLACGSTDADFGRTCQKGSGDPESSGYSGFGERLVDWIVGTVELGVHVIGSKLAWLWERFESAFQVVVDAVDTVWDCITNIRECLDLGPGGGSGGGGGNNPMCEVCPWLCVGGMGHSGSDDAMTACIDAIMASILDKDSDDPFDMMSPWYVPEMEGVDG